MNRTHYVAIPVGPALTDQPSALESLCVATVSHCSPFPIQFAPLRFPNTLRFLFLFMETPPHYQRTVAANDCFCRLCVSYEEGYCKMYGVPVGHNYTCDRWKRNWNIQ